MIRTLLVGVALFALATPVHAKKVKKSILPPPQFDHPFEGTITVIRISDGSSPCRPRSLSTRLGCAYPPKTLDERDVCVIYLAFPDEIKKAGYSENDLWRHEIAFCNGWKEYRPLGDDSQVIELDKEMKKEKEKKQNWPEIIAALRKRFPNFESAESVFDEPNGGYQVTFYTKNGHMSCKLTLPAKLGKCRIIHA